MEFPYEYYSYNTLYWPVIFILLSSFFLCGGLYQFFLKCVRKRLSKDDFKLLLCLGLLISIIPNGKCLLNGGLDLLKDRDLEPLECSGIVESIQTPTERFPGFKYDHRYGADIVIDGKMFFAVSSGDIEAGDAVTIRYLPNSRFILSIYATPPE